MCHRTHHRKSSHVTGRIRKNRSCICIKHFRIQRKKLWTQQIFILCTWYTVYRTLYHFSNLSAHKAVIMLFIERLVVFKLWNSNVWNFDKNLARGRRGSIIRVRRSDTDRLYHFQSLADGQTFSILKITANKRDKMRN